VYIANTGPYVSTGKYSDRRIMSSTILSNNSDYTISGDYSEQTFEVGLGAEYNINENLSVNLEFLMYEGVLDSVELNATALNVKYKF